MKVSFSNHNLAAHLTELKALPLSFTSTAGLPEQMVCAPVAARVRTLDDCDLGFLFCYDIFPPCILRFFGEWELHGREMRPGDVIVQQAQIPPAAWGVKLLFGVRVLSVERGAERAGFSYGTLAGHPETGVNAFHFSLESGRLDAVIRTTAEPVLPISRLLARIFTRPYVAWCNRQALRQMVESFARCNATRITANLNGSNS